VITSDQVFLNEEKATVNLDNMAPCDVAWYLDTSVSNHMTGSVNSFADIDTSIIGTVRFGDASVVDIKGLCSSQNMVTIKLSRMSTTFQD
jgi:hypothetical protein